MFQVLKNQTRRPAPRIVISDPESEEETVGAKVATVSNLLFSSLPAVYY